MIPERNSTKSTSKKYWKELDTYVHKIAEEMGLGQWYITLSQDRPIENDTLCSVYICKESVEISISVADLFWEKDKEYQRWCIVHEFVHVLHAPFWNANYEYVKSISPASYDVLDQLEERFVDQISFMLSPLYTLPSFQKESKKYQGGDHE